MIGVNVQTLNVERVVTRVIAGKVFAEVAIQDAIHNILKDGLTIAQMNVARFVYSQPSTYEDRRTGDLYRAIKASRFFATGGQIYVSKQGLKRWYAPFVESGFTHKGGTHVEGRHYWIPPTEAMLRTLVIEEMDKAALLTAKMMV